MMGLLVSIWTVLTIVYLTNGQSVTVQTNLGQIRGTTTRIAGEPLVTFFGIPYAEPPVRFQKPIPKTPWTGVLDALQFGPVCMQAFSQLNVSEDCLSLNIYVPRTLTQPKAVMVWIHGGGYVVGSGSQYQGAYLAMQGDVVVVTINYRLGLFGFLTTGDSSAPGNYGLWDQHLAMRWVKENIASFGGNSDLITIFGESAGGYTIGLHILSSVNNGLFNRVICQSGVGLSPRVIGFDTQTVTMNLADILRCNGSSTQAVIRCLQQHDAWDILRGTVFALGQNRLAFTLRIGPQVDRDFLVDTPENIMANPGLLRSLPISFVDLMTGTMSAEGGLILGPLNQYSGPLRFNLRDGIPTRVLCDNISPALARDYYNNNERVSSAICQQYRDPNLIAQAQQVINMYGDMMMVAPTVHTLRTHVNVSTRRRYHYLFSHRPVFRRPQFSWMQGTGHGDELGLLFFDPRVVRNPIDRAVAQSMGSYWTNFAKTGYVGL